MESADNESVITLLQQVAERMDARFEALERRFDTIGSRLDRVNDTLGSVQSQMAAMTRWADRFDRDLGATLATQAGQQRAIDSLAERVSRLESRKAS